MPKPQRKSPERMKANGQAKQPVPEPHRKVWLGCGAKSNGPAWELGPDGGRPASAVPTFQRRPRWERATPGQIASAGTPPCRHGACTKHERHARWREPARHQAGRAMNNTHPIASPGARARTADPKSIPYGRWGRNSTPRWSADHPTCASASRNPYAH